MTSYMCGICRIIFDNQWNFSNHTCDIVTTCTGDVITSPPTMIEASKHDSGKPDLTLIRLDAIEQVARVFSFGAKKYPKDGRQSNYLKGMSWSRLLAAAMRHIMAYAAGEDCDKESLENHLAHACCCLLMLLTYKAQNLGTDDRDVVSRPKT